MDEDVSQWAQAQWGQCELGNSLRNQHPRGGVFRAVEIGMRMAEQPGAGLPEQMGSTAMLKGAYRLLNSPVVDPEALWKPHHAATIAAAGKIKTVVFIQDWTTLDLASRPPLERVAYGHLQPSSPDHGHRTGRITAATGDVAAQCAGVCV